MFVISNGVMEVAENVMFSGTEDNVLLVVMTRKAPGYGISCLLTVALLLLIVDI